MGQLFLAQGGSWWPGHVRRRLCPQHHRRQGTPATTVARKGAQEWQLELEMAMTRLVGMEKAYNSGNELGSRAWQRRPWWLRSGAARARAREREGTGQLWRSVKEEYGMRQRVALE